MYEMICDLAKDTHSHAHEAKENEAGGGSKASKHWKQQGRAVPNLIFQAEDFEAAAFALAQKLGPGTLSCPYALHQALPQIKCIVRATQLDYWRR